MKSNLIEHQVQRHLAAAEIIAKGARKCPVCSDTKLIASQRQDVEIDSCPRCRGVWLDRGELEKIIKRATEQSTDSEPRLQENQISSTRNLTKANRTDNQPGNRGWRAQKNFWLRELFGLTEK